MIRIIAILLLSCNLAVAQISQQTIVNEITANLPTNNQNEISAELLRNTLNQMTSAIFQNQGLSGLTITNTATIGEALIATGTTTASWQNIGGLITSVSNNDGSLNVSPTTGNVIASLNTNHVNVWTQSQTFNVGITGNSPYNILNPGGAPYYLIIPNAVNPYLIANGLQVSQGTPILATSQFGENAVGIQQAIVGTVNVATGDTAGNAAFALSGYGLSNSTTTGAVGVGGFAMCGITGCNEIDGANQVVANAATLQGGTGFDYTLMIGNQVNINLRQKTGSVNPSGPLYGYYVVGGGNATNNTGNAYAADQLSIITAAKWTNAFSSFNGAAVTAMNIGTVSGTAGSPPTNSASQPIVFNSYSSSANNQATISTGNSGNLIFASPLGFSFTVNGVSELDFGSVNGANWTFGNGANVFIPGILLASANVAATSTTTGAFRLTGGIGVTGAAFFGSTMNSPNIQSSTIYSAAGTALPVCAAGTNGMSAVVSDATGATYASAYTSGGGQTRRVLCINGTGWTTQ